MSGYHLIVPYTILLCLLCWTTVSSSPVIDDCPCSDPAWCQPIKTTPKKELLAFSVEGANWRQYPWDNLTTVALFGKYDAEIMCYAHSKGVRVVPGASFPASILSNNTAREAWVNNAVATAMKQHMDGINLDIEFTLNSSESALLVSMVKQTADAFRKALPHSMISFDSPCAPGCTYGRCYDYKGVADNVDYIMIMAYDELYRNGTGNANAPFNVTASGLDQFLHLGIPASKLVLGVPWYGYNFPCDTLTKDNNCTGKGTATQVNYSGIMKLLEYNSTSGRLWSKEARSPYFNYKNDNSGQMFQMWYDDPMSSTLRYNLSKDKGLYGVAMWTADSLDYSDDPLAQKQTKAMWDAFLGFGKS